MAGTSILLMRPGRLVVSGIVLGMVSGVGSSMGKWILIWLERISL